MISAYDLPTSLEIGGVGYSIRWQWRAVVDILCACSDPALDADAQAFCILKIMYPDFEKMPPERYQEALEKACAFIDCGQTDDGKTKPRLIDWEKDAPIIIPEVNKVAGREVRMCPDMHWWEFFGAFLGVGDGLLASVIHIRKKKAAHKKLETWEQEFYRENKSLIDFDKHNNEEITAEKEALLKWLTR